MEKTKAYAIYATFIAISLGAFISALILTQIIQNREQEKRRLQLVNIHSSAVTQLQSNINQFAAIASALRTYTQKTEGIPTAYGFQMFMNDLLEELNFEGQYSISVIDSTHRFIYTFDADEVDPESLSGNLIPQINNKEIIARLDSIMMDEEIHMSQPINLLEGWLGLSFSFGLYQNGIPIGYVTPILSMKEVLDSYYSDEVSSQFNFTFKTQMGQYFDQHKIYNHPQEDNHITTKQTLNDFDTSEDEIINSSLNLHGQNFIISTSFKENLSPFNLTNITIAIGCILFNLLVGLIFFQALRVKRMNIELLKNQDVINKQATELGIQNTELKELNRAKDLFFSIIGHDLKSPIANIHSMMDFLGKRSLPEKEKQELYTRLKSATRKTLDLLDNILNWAMLNTNRLAVNREKVSLIEVSKEVISNIESMASQKNIKLRVNSDDDLIVQADKNMIETSIRNLISNAIKFTPKDGMVTVIGEKASNSVSLFICDTGIGISPERLDGLFDLGEKDITKDTDGNSSSGFGLILTKEFIEKNGGSLRLESILEKGSTFEVSFDT